jgi:hypothetical protein
MEAMQGMSLYSYLYLKLAKMLCLSYYPLMFSLQQNWTKRCPEVGWEVGVAKTMYTHVNKYKNKI